jgi:4-amino-4-deoxy-L-arabinose transferase-like glycosyltransferase
VEAEVQRGEHQPAENTHQDQRYRLGAALILGLFVALATLYSIATPIFEASDEFRHYPFVQHLATGGGLPIQHADHVQAWHQEGSQPPLYYALAAALTFWVNTSDMPAVHVPNPHARIGLPLATDNRNLALHSERERFPWHGTTLAVHLARLFSVLLGAGTVWCTYRLARLVVPNKPWLALGAMALNAFLPMFLFISGSVNNDNLVTLLASLSLLLLVRLSRGQAPRYAPVLLGVLTGLAALSKLSGLGLLALAPVALALREWRAWRGCSRPDARATWRALGRIVRECAVVYALAALVAGWWYVRNWRLYGDPLGIATMVQFMGFRQTLPTWSEILGEFRGLRMSFWGVFGGFNVLLRPGWLYTLLDGFTLLALVGLGVGCVRARRRLGEEAWEALGLLALWITIEAVALARWTLITLASQGRLLFPAITAICLFLSLGISSWLPRRAQRVALGGVAGALLALALAVPFVVIRPAYARPPILTLADIPAQAKPYNVIYGDQMRLLAYEVEPASVRPGEALTVRLYWQALAAMERDYSIYVHLFGLHDEPLGQRDTYPGGGAYPTTQWSPGEIVCDTLEVPIRADARCPVALRVVVGLYDLETMQNLRAVDERGNAIGRPLLMRVKLVASTPAVAPDHALDIALGNAVRLVGYDLGDDALAPGGELAFTLYWRVEGALDKDYTVFVHLVGADGQIAGQGDGPPTDNEYPTSYWERGELVVDARVVALPGDMPPGAYRLCVGLYDPASGMRLTTAGGEGATEGDAIVLGTVQVSATR